MKLYTQPYLLTLNPSDEMNILWIQSEATDAFVEYGYDQRLQERECVKTYEIKGLRTPLADGTYTDNPFDHPEVSVWQNIATLKNLKPGKKVYYRCCYDGNYTKTYFFHTAPQSGESYRFAQISDLQSLPDCHKTVHQSGLFHPDFILFSGDANYTTWRMDQWFDVDESWQSKEDAIKAFFPCMQQENGARLMQYAPLFFSPGNHEPNNMKCSEGGTIEETKHKWSWSIFMEIMRPLYSCADKGINGVRWYSANYSDMHITSLSINKFRHFNPNGKGVWLSIDSVEPKSPQISWLIDDLEKDNSKFKWVIQHFHILAKAWDAKFNLCEPVFDHNGNAIYPNDRTELLVDIFSKYGVNAVSYGHSHVYERYFVRGTHYIEAAYMSITFSRGDDKPHPWGNVPVCEDNSKRSFLIVERKKGGLFAKGYYAEEEGSVLFDSYRIADEDGNSVPPPKAEDI